MLKSHERFYSTNGKRLVLIAEDELINREILRKNLEEKYELVFAENGLETIEMMRANKDILSLVLLDLVMPIMNGIEVLKRAREDTDISQIPIIVITSDNTAEVESLELGAIDFIPKPYPEYDVIHARITRTIELFEDRHIIRSTERDELTGLYNRDYFYNYAEKYDQYHRDVEMDAIVVDVNHFHMFNERFGRARGDDMLRHIGEALRSTVTANDGIVCRREADVFMIYCPHGIDYAEILERASASLAESSGASRIWMRMGVYASVDKTLEIERRFDRAKTAADTVQGSFAKNIGFYDESLHERELYLEQLIEDFPAAIEQKQFQVFFQPKYDIRADAPFLASAEALIRWQHPDQGMIEPGTFIPLFEDNGLIQNLDLYVWRETAAHIADWKERLGFSVPVSVNVSRIDFYDPHLADTFANLLDEYGLSTSDLLLEVTESAYIHDADQLIESINGLREMGFKIEMDDFGTGYSSLNMISAMPIDVLKLDMQFIRNAFGERKDVKMLEVIIDIADYLSAPVIAEGVETEEQMNMLKEMGCDYVQGYYFSKPVTSSDFERFLIERRDRHEAR